MTGTQPQQSTLGCYKTATFNPITCQWDVTGSSSPVITTTATACDSYTWAVNGVTYPCSGSYMYHDAAGCQDYALNLTVTPSTANTLRTLSYVPYTWAITAQTYTESGTYTTVNGCHTETLILTMLTASGNTTDTNSATVAADVTVNTGKLTAANDRHSGTINGSGTVTVTGDVGIGGNGSVGNLVVRDGGQVEPGNSPGDLQADAVTLGPDGVFEFEINDATGTAGNTATATTTFTVSNTTPPTIQCPTYDPAPAVVNLTDATAFSSCGVTLTWKIDNQTPASDTVTLEPGCHTIVWTATDVVGNSTTCIRTIQKVSNLSRVKEGESYYNWRVKHTSWSNATMSFYHNPAQPGSTLDSVRVTFRGVVQKVDPKTGAVVGGFSNATVVVDAFDGSLSKPSSKDQYAIKVYDQNNRLWWGSTPSTTPQPGLPLANGGSGGGRIKIYSK